MVKAFIEMPKGDNRRRHMKHDKSGFVDSGPLVDFVPVNNGIMPVNYGYIPGALNQHEGDELDILVLSDEQMVPGQELEADPIALLKRADGDDKLVAVDTTRAAIKKWRDIPQSERDLLISFFSYYHPLEIIEDQKYIEQYIADGYLAFINAQQ